ncbi:MAG: glutamate--tRNA ligase, partial [Pseudohongiellaceae bacterium]
RDILELLQWLGLAWDEGPGVGGDFGPYRQSERSAIYHEHIKILLERGDAYYCFCTEERLQRLRRQQVEEKRNTGYDGHCLHLSNKEVQQRLSAKEEHVVRMKVPGQGECTFHDTLRGEISIAWSQVDMQVLTKSDGLPTYHFANVVDDHLMQISHVVRGEEWINSTPKHLLLYQYFGWEPPEFCHMPLLRNPDKSKLSKRKNPTSIGYYRDMGYLPQALVNYLGTMGWTMPDGEEKFTIEQMTEHFDLERVSLGGPVFDIEKLNWLNGKYLREDFSAGEFVRLYADWAFRDEKVRDVVPLLQPRVERLSDVMPLAGFFLSGLVDIAAASFEHKKLSGQECRMILQLSLWRLERLETWERGSVELCLQTLAEALELKIRDFLFPLFITITGKAVSTSVIDAIAILGLEITRARFRHGLAVLGGVSKKEAKELERRFRDID